MSQIAEVNSQILDVILKTDPFYQALWGKEDFTPSGTITGPNDYNCGAFCNALEYLYGYIRELTEDDITLLEDPYIDIVIFFFTGLYRDLGESNTSLISRMRSLIVREDTWRSERFGTPWDILNVLSYYIDKSLLYYIPNVVLTDILINGEFELALSGEWTILPSGDRSIGDSFQGTYKLDFSGFTSAAQTVAVTAGSYILNSFIDPSVAPSGDTDIFNIIFQRDSDSYYFNTTTLEWVSSDPGNKFTTSSDGYQLAEFFMVSDGSYNVTITFSKIVDFLLDRVEFGLKLYPAYEILFIDSVNATNFASTWVVGETQFENASFLDQDFMYNSTSIYSDDFMQSILDTVTASGVKGIFNRETRT